MWPRKLVLTARRSLTGSFQSASPNIQALRSPPHLPAHESRSGGQQVWCPQTVPTVAPPTVLPTCLFPNTRNRPGAHPANPMNPNIPVGGVQIRVWPDRPLPAPTLQASSMRSFPSDQRGARSDAQGPPPPRLSRGGGGWAGTWI